MRSTYNSERNYRIYPSYDRGISGPEIDDATQFDEVRIECLPEGFVIGRAFLYNDGVKVTQVPAHYMNGAVVPMARCRYDRDDPEVGIVRAKIASGDCQVNFSSLEVLEETIVLSSEQLHASGWLVDLLHPFHADDRDLFFQHLTENLGYTAPEHGEPQRFTFPGIVEGANRTYYKRQDIAPPPDVRSMGGLAADGWTVNVPYGPYRLHSVQVTETPGGAPIVEASKRVYWRRPDVDASIRAIARTWHEYWTGLTSSEQGINTRMTARKHVEHAIGRAWTAKPFGDNIRVFYEGHSGAQTRHAIDVEDWFLGNLEQWAHEWGWPAFAAALAEGTNRAALDSQLGDYTYCLINRDGSVGDRLANPNEGILQATWDAWGSTHYNAALGTLISVDAGADQTVESGVDVVMVSATVINAMGTTTYRWEQESGATRPLLPADTANTVFAAPRLAVGDDPAVLVFRVTATNNGESASDTITITVNAPAAPEE